MKIRQVGAELFRADGHEVDTRFSQFRERACRGKGVPAHVMQVYGDVEAYEYLHLFLTSALVAADC